MMQHRLPWAVLAAIVLLPLSSDASPGAVASSPQDVVLQSYRPNESPASTEHVLKAKPVAYSKQNVRGSINIANIRGFAAERTFMEHYNRGRRGPYKLHLVAGNSTQWDLANGCRFLQPGCIPRQFQVKILGKVGKPPPYAGYVAAMKWDHGFGKCCFVVPRDHAAGLVAHLKALAEKTGDSRFLTQARRVIAHPHSLAEAERTVVAGIAATKGWSVFTKEVLTDARSSGNLAAASRVLWAGLNPAKPNKSSAIGATRSAAKAASRLTERMAARLNSRALYLAQRTAVPQVLSAIGATRSAAKMASGLAKGMPAARYARALRHVPKAAGPLALAATVAAISFHYSDWMDGRPGAGYELAASVLGAGCAGVGAVATGVSAGAAAPIALTLCSAADIAASAAGDHLAADAVHEHHLSQLANIKAALADEIRQAMGPAYKDRPFGASNFWALQERH